MHLPGRLVAEAEGVPARIEEDDEAPVDPDPRPAGRRSIRVRGGGGQVLDAQVEIELLRNWRYPARSVAVIERQLEGDAGSPSPMVIQSSSARSVSQPSRAV